MFFVIGLLDLAAAVRFVDGFPHGIGDAVGVHDHTAVIVSRRPSDGLDQRAFRPQETFFIGVENEDQGNLGQVETFPQQIDADQHIVGTQTQIADDLRSFQCFHIVMKVSDFNARFLKIFRQILGHPFGQGGHENTLVFGDAVADLRRQVVDLSLDGTNLDFRIEKPRGTDDLFGDAGMAIQLIIAGSGGNIDDLIDLLLKFLEFQRAVIQRRGQTEAVIDEDFLAGAVTAVHPADLRDRHMAFVDEKEKVIGEEVHERIGRFALFPPGQMAGIVFDPGAVPHFFHHFQVEAGTLFQPLGFQQFIFRPQHGQSFFQFFFDIGNGGFHPFLVGHIVGRREDHHMAHIVKDLTGDDIGLHDAFDLIAEHFHANDLLRGGGGVNFEYIAANAEFRTVQIHIVAGILNGDQLFHDFFSRDLLPFPKAHGHGAVIFGIPQTVNGGNAGHDDHITAFKKRRRCRVAKPLDLVVNGRVFFDIGIASGYIGLGLIIIVKADEIFHGVIGEEFFEFTAELRRQCFIMDHHQRGAVHLRDDIGHGEGLTAAGHAEEDLIAFPLIKAAQKGIDSFRLTAARLIRRC